MNFKDTLNKIVNRYLTEEGLVRLEKEVAIPSIKPFRLFNERDDEEYSDEDKKTDKFITSLSREVTQLLNSEFTRNASVIKLNLARGETKEAALLKVLMSVEAEHICPKHSKITCKTCFGNAFEYAPLDKTASEFKKIHEGISAVYTNSANERMWLNDRIEEILNRRESSSRAMNDYEGLSNSVSQFIMNNLFEYDNKRGYVGTIIVPEYIKAYVADLYFDDSKTLQEKRICLSIEVETIYQKAFKSWTDYNNKQAYTIKKPAADWLKGVEPNHKIYDMLDKKIPA